MVRVVPETEQPTALGAVTFPSVHIIGRDPLRQLLVTVAEPDDIAMIPEHELTIGAEK